MRILILILLLYIFSACTKESRDKNYASINGEITASLALNQGDTTLYFYFQSHGKYDSYCKYIDGDMLQDQNKLHFNLHGVVLDKDSHYDTCGGAFVSFLFPYLTNGKYPIFIKVSNRPEYKGNLFVSDRKFEVIMDNTNTNEFRLTRSVVEY